MVKPKTLKEAERRARAIADAAMKLDAAATAPGVDPERTARYLSGELKGVPVDERGDVHVRVPRDLIERADVLLEKLKTRRDLFGWRKANRTQLIRVALDRALTQLESEAERDEQ